MKGLRQKQQQQQLILLIQRERTRCMNAVAEYFDNSVQRIKEAYEAVYQDDNIDEDEPMVILAPATPPPKDKEEESSSESAVSSLDDDEDDEDDNDLDDFVDDDMNDDAEAPPKKIKTYSKREAASWIKPPAAPKRVRRTPTRFEPDVPDKATAKREREAEQGAETLTSANAKATPKDKAELRKIYKAHQKYNSWQSIDGSSNWFRARYGSAIGMIRSALGRENAGQAKAQEIFDNICHYSLSDREHEPAFKPLACGNQLKTFCCLCNEQKYCHEWLVDVVKAETFPIGSTCAQLAMAIMSFFALLRDGGSVDELDAAFLRVMEAHEAKSSRKRRRRK